MEKTEKKLTGIELIAQERKRQIENEGWSLLDDIKHNKGELAMAAACYALPNQLRQLKSKADAFNTRGATLLPKHWPWKHDIITWKPSAHDRIRELQKAGALIAAEIDRLQNSES